MFTRKEIGNSGENIASEFLSKKNGFLILDRNYQRPWGEIDIIARKDKVIHFIEVKTLSVSRENNQIDFYEAEEKVDYRKRKRMRRIIATYLMENRINNDYMIDIISIYLDKKGKIADINFLEDITL